MQRQGKTRSDMPWIETEVDEELLGFIKNYNTQSKPKVMELLKKLQRVALKMLNSQELKLVTNVMVTVVKAVIHQKLVLNVMVEVR